MPVSVKLSERNQGLCELCNAGTATHEYLVSPRKEEIIQNQVALCSTCFEKLAEKGPGDYWRCLEGSIWNPEPAVQALSYRILFFYKDEEWAENVISSIQLDEDVIQWALSVFEMADEHRDAFGNKLENGDNIVLTQALNVKGTSFSAAKGTVVKKIRLVPGNTEQIEGKINEQTIVILTKYVKKA